MRRIRRDHSDQPEWERTVLAAGRRVIGCEHGPPVPLDGPRTVSTSDEHTVVSWPGAPPALGAAVALRPSQIRTMFNLHDEVWLADGSGCLPVAARVVPGSRGAEVGNGRYRLAVWPVP